jgi:hypothetical protein
MYVAPNRTCPQAHQTPSRRPKPPRLAPSSRYTIERELGGGGMAAVYLGVRLKWLRSSPYRVSTPDPVCRIHPLTRRRTLALTAIGSDVLKY